MKTRNTILVLLTLGVLAVTAGCRDSERQGTHEARSDAAESQTLRVGGLLSMTGGAAAYGEETDKGIRLAVSEIEASGSPVQVKYMLADDKSDKNEAVKAARTLVELQGAQVILGPAISPAALSAGKYAEEHGTPMVSTSAIQDEVTVSPEYDRTYVSRVCFNNTFQGTVLARFAYNDLKVRSVAIVYDKTLSYSLGVARTFRQEFERLGGKVPHEEGYSVNDTDYSPLIGKVARFQVDALFIPGWDENVGPMLKQAGNRWDRFTLIGPEAWPSNRLLELAGGNIKKAYTLAHYFPGDKDPRVQKFVQSYQKQYGETPSSFSALGYDGMMMIWEAAKRTKSFKGQDLRDAINTTRNLPSVTGNITLDPQRNAVKDAIILKVEPREFLFLKRITQS